ncbi:AAA family ATPase [Streptomyces sp. NPDC002886]|uniref:AAA family ATPase n=1 Tax=Streptomyces sp. NPDC002886 TaxID=3364667 RepID=UPI0036BD6283
MTLTHISVKKLFGELDHEIPVHWREGLTLLHGPNGTGKTSVLRILDSLFNKRFSRLRKIPVEELVVTFADETRLVVSWRTGSRARKRRGVSEVGLTFELHGSSGDPETWIWTPGHEFDFPLGMIDDFVPHLLRVGPQAWRDERTGQVLDVEEVFDRYSDQMPAGLVRNVASAPKIPAWLLETLGSNPVYLIEAQRLVPQISRNPRRGREGSNQTTTVAFYGEELASKIKNALADYAEYSQSLDSTFPNRLLKTQREGRRVPSDKEIQARYTAQADRRKSYVEIGLIDAGDELQLPENLDHAARRVLDTYLDDIDDKFDRLNGLAQRLQLFLEIVNGKLRRVSLEAAREGGLIARTRKKRELIDLESLSSGEQQEIVIAYGLLFRELAGTLVLIDEPELSLHVSWQLDFIPDLLRIAKVADLEFVAATHSPQIVNDRWDLAVALSDGV